MGDSADSLPFDWRWRSDMPEKVITASSPRPLRVLCVEDSEADARLIFHSLQRGGFDVRGRRVVDAAEMFRALDQDWDVVIADHSLPGFSGVEALNILRQRNLDIPFIIVSGQIEESVAIAAMRAGAHDYVMKDRLARLLPVIERELREADIRRATRKFEAELKRAHDELEQRVEKRTADLQAANQKLQEMIEERRRLEAELLEIAENERRRIGFDLHDDVGQKLAGAAMMLKSVETRLAARAIDVAEDVTRIQTLIEDITRHTHDLARNFTALDAGDGNVVDVLRGLCDKVERTFDGVICSFQVKGEISAVPPQPIAQIYKIIQEAISNSVKHARARRISIAATGSPEKICFTVKNDGKPFTPPPVASKRLGLRIMHYRANMIGASLDIRAAGKSGTVVTCVYPLKKIERKPARSILQQPMASPSPGDAVPLKITAEITPRIDGVASSTIQKPASVASASR
jgi:signal transduction histidine kinase